MRLPTVLKDSLKHLGRFQKMFTTHLCKAEKKVAQRK